MLVNEHHESWADDSTGPIDENTEEAEVIQPQMFLITSITFMTWFTLHNFRQSNTCGSLTWKYMALKTFKLTKFLEKWQG